MDETATAVAGKTEPNAARSEVKLPPVVRKMVPQKRWDQMRPAEKGANSLIGILQIVLTIWALLDIRRRPAEQIKGKKRTWAMVALIQPFGPVIYFLFGRKK